MVHPGLKAFFEECPEAALAFSGGTDSSYLLSAAIECGARVRAYYVRAQFQPEFEFEDAKKLAASLGADMRVIELDVLSDSRVAANPPDRCYYCKQNIFGNILKAASEDGFSVVIDGTNASDDADDRPGMKALREMSVRSPLREAGITKAEVRRLSKEAGLFTWNKPAYACLATRIPAGEPITARKLAMTEEAESFLFGLGFSDIRVRTLPAAGGKLFARLQFPEAQTDALLEKSSEVSARLKEIGYAGTLLDLEVRR